MTMLATVTDLSAYRAAMRPIVRKACSWHEAAESITASNMLIADASVKAYFRVLAAQQRVLFRTLMGV